MLFVLLLTHSMKHVTPYRGRGFINDTHQHCLR